MERRRVLKILGGTAGVPFVAPACLAEFIDLGLRIRSELVVPRSSSAVTLTPAQFRVVTALADVIIPETDTPGASAADVAGFVDTLATGWLDAADRDRFLAGVDTVDPSAREAHGADFADLDDGLQSDVVRALDQEVDRLRRDATADETTHFFYDIKRFTLAGYFTSEVGLRTLGYRIVPGAFEGCVLIDQYGTGGVR